MRRAILELLDDDALLGRFWVGRGDNDAAQAGSLRTKLETTARAEYACSLRSWFARLRPLDAWGDGNTLIGAALLFNVRIHVISTL